MANLEKAIVQEISDNTVLAALLARASNPTELNIFKGSVPKGFLEPSTTVNSKYLVYNTVGTKFNQLFAFSIQTIQFSIFADKYSDAKSIRDEIISVFHRFRQATLGSGGNTQVVKFASVKNALDLKDPESGMHMLIMDVAFKVSE